MPAIEPIEQPRDSARTATTSAWSAWSWVDVARYAGWGAAGGGMAAVCAALTSLAPAGDAYTRTVATLAVLLAWAIPLTSALCVAGGPPQRVARVWRGALGRAGLVIVPSMVVASLLFLVLPPLFPDRAGALLAPVVAWPAVGLGVALALHAAWPRQHPLPVMLCSGIVGGVLAGLFGHGLGGMLGAWPGPWARLAAHAAAAIPAGFLLGLSVALLRESTKTRWLLVIFGAHPGRHYLLDARPMVLGSDPACEMNFPHALPRHLTFTPRPHGVQLMLAPDALVRVNNRAPQLLELYDGDDVQIGDTVCRYFEVP